MKPLDPVLSPSDIPGTKGDDLENYYVSCMKTNRSAINHLIKRQLGTEAWLLGMTIFFVSSLLTAIVMRLM